RLVQAPRVSYAIDLRRVADIFSGEIHRVARGQPKRKEDDRRHDDQHNRQLDQATEYITAHAVQPRRRSRWPSTSSKPSPARFSASTVMRIAVPGYSASSGRSKM